METTQGRFNVKRVTMDPVTIPKSIFDETAESSDTYKRKMSFYNVDDEKALATAMKSDDTKLTLYEDDLRYHTFGEDCEDDVSQKSKANLGTFFGIILPCCQNIVGVIFFVRLPWIVGCAGILEGLLIVGMCCMVSLTVAISISAIATNGRVTGGGTYFMISRSLGPAFGGSVGILFFMGTSISVAMYFIGTVETLLNYIAPEMSLFGGDELSVSRLHDYRVYGTILLVLIAIIVFVGVSCVQRFGLFAICFLVTAILSVLVGIFVANEEDSLRVCKIGNQVLRYDFVHHENGSWVCNANKDGPIYKSYCDLNGTCDDFFLNNKPHLVPAIPGLRLRLLKENLYQVYTSWENIPGTETLAKSGRDIVTDITTSFVVLMSIYFPSITGVESGSNYSGDLRDPQRSIPLGTMIAVTLTSCLYMSVVVLFGGSVEGPVLTDKYGSSISPNGELMLSLMAWPSKWVVLVGTLTATIGAGMQAMAGGPRLLLAISTDNIFPVLACFSVTWRGEPTRCLCVTFLIALTGILISKLDYVAPIVTMFFLMCYGFINFAVTLQSLLDLPHWRPSFKYHHWSFTLLGTSLCICIMFMSNWIYALVAISIAFCLYQYIEYKGAEKEWGDGMTGLSMSAAIYALGKLKQDYCHTKNWRPQLLVLLKPKETETTQFNHENLTLIRLAMMMQTGRGLTMYGSVLHGLLDEHAEHIESYKQICHQKLNALGAKGFVDMAVSNNVTDALSCMLQCAGLGPLHPNTVIMGWPKDWIHSRNMFSYHIFLDTMRNIALGSKAAIVLKAANFPAISERMTGTIDIWWIVNDGGMLLLLAHLLRRTKTWGRCRLRVFSVADANDNTLQIEMDLKKYLKDLRLDCVVEVVEMPSGAISAYVYERTLKSEERTRLLSFMSKHKKKREAQSVLEKARSACDFTKLQKDFEEQDKFNKNDLPNAKNVLHMNTAVQINNLMKEKSAEASLIIINLPCVPEKSSAQANYMSFLETLTEDLESVVLVRGTGSEVITIFN